MSQFCRVFIIGLTDTRNTNLMKILDGERQTERDRLSVHQRIERIVLKRIWNDDDDDAETWNRQTYDQNDAADSC